MSVRKYLCEAEVNFKDFDLKFIPAPDNRTASEMKWNNFAVCAVPQYRWPILIKVRPDINVAKDGKGPYFVGIFARKGESRQGNRKTLDKYEVRVEPIRNKGVLPAAELRFFDYAVGDDVRFFGEQPLAQFRVRGILYGSEPRVYRNAVLFAVPAGAKCRPYCVPLESEVLWVGPALVQIPETAGKREQLANAMKVMLLGVPDIYDHRKNWLQPFGMVEHIEKSESGRSFQFFNIRDFDGEPEEVSHIITESGLAEVE